MLDAGEQEVARCRTRIPLPPIPRASLEELERRRALFAQAMALRDEIGPIEMRSADLVRQSREDSD